MKRSRLLRSTRLRRRTPLRPVNRARRVELYDRNFGQRGDLVRAMPCLLLGNECEGPIEACHARSRGAGGDRRDLVPLCAKHHSEQHRRGIRTFNATHGLDLAVAAARIAAELDARGLP